MANQENSYQYSAITQPDIIRLILLQASEHLEAELYCSLIDASLKGCDNDVVEHYVALSYVWGDATLKGSILVDGRSLEITHSLETALRHVRDPRRALRVWADGICINQKDVDDRNTQVALMSLIYTTARHTIIFLGASCPRHDTVLDTIAGLDPEKIEENDSIDSLGRLTDDILEHPWFTRVWILQELVLSQDPWVQSGGPRDIVLDSEANSMALEEDLGSPILVVDPTQRDQDMLDAARQSVAVEAAIVSRRTPSRRDSGYESSSTQQQEAQVPQRLIRNAEVNGNATSQNQQLSYMVTLRLPSRGARRSSRQRRRPRRFVDETAKEIRSGGIRRGRR